MPQQSIGALQRILNDIAASMNLGGALLHPILMGYIALFGTLAVVWVAYALLWNGHALPSAIGLLVRLTLVMWTLARWPWFLGGIRDIALNLGLTATGNQLQLGDFLDPGALVKAGIDSGAVLWRAYQNNLGWGPNSWVIGAAYLAAWLGYVGAYTVMAYKVFWWQVELLLASLGGMCLLPTLCFRGTAFVATGTLSFAANMGVRFLIGSLLAGAMWAHLRTLSSLARPGVALSLASVDFTIQEAFYATALAMILGAAFLSVNRIAGMLTSGVPGMAGGQTLGSFVRMVAGGVAGVVTMGAAAGTGAAGIARVGVAGMQGMVGAGRSLPAALGTGSMGGAARQLYAGARSGMSGGAQAQLGQLMGVSTQVGNWSGQVTLGQLMGASHSGRGDQSYQGVRR